MRTLEQIDADLQAAEAVHQEAAGALNRAFQAVRALALEQAEVRYGLKYGGLVQNRLGKVFRVVRIDAKYHLWVTGRRQLKDGSFGLRDTPLLSDWHVPGYPKYTP